MRKWTTSTHEEVIIYSALLNVTRALSIALGERPQIYRRSRTNFFATSFAALTWMPFGPGALPQYMDYAACSSARSRLEKDSVSRCLSLWVPLGGVTIRASERLSAFCGRVRAPEGMRRSRSSLLCEKPEKCTLMCTKHRHVALKGPSSEQPRNRDG